MEEIDYQRVEEGGLVSKILQIKKDLEGGKEGNSSSQSDTRKITLQDVISEF